jgi:hypothetical protein
MLSQIADWEENLMNNWDHSRAKGDAEGMAFYAVDASFDFSPKRFEELQEDFVHHLISHEILELDYNPNLKIHRKLDEHEEQFCARCLEKLREDYAQEYQTLLDTLERQENRLKERLERETREHGDALAEAGDQNGGDHQRQMDAQASMVDMDDIQRELLEIEKLREIKLKEFENNLDTLARQIEKDIMRVNHGNVKILNFALVWLPFTEFVIQDGPNRRLELIRSF